MADQKISALTATSPAVGTHRIPIAISPFGAGDNGYLTVATLCASPALTGTPTAPTQAPGDNSTKIATTAYVDSLSLTIGTGLTNTAGTLTANLATGISGGQSVVGGTASGNSLTVSSTAHATKGTIILGSTIYNETANTWNRSFIAQVASTGTVPSSFTNTAAAHTGLTASTARVENDFVGASQQWANGTVGTQIFTYFRGHTVTGSAPTAIFTSIYNVFIDPVTVSTNASSSNQYALGLGGNLRFTAAATIRGESSIDISSSSAFSVVTNSVQRLQISNLGSFSILNLSSAGIASTQPVFSATTPVMFTLTGGAHTTLTVAEATQINFNFSANFQFSTGTVATQRLFRIQSPVYLVSGGGTVTRSASLSIGGPAKAGTGAALTTAIGLEVETRDVSGGNGVTTAYAAFFNASTGATNNYGVGISGDLVLTTAGNKLRIKEGTDGSMGQTTLVSGTKAITINGLTTSSRAYVTLVTPSGVTLTVTYQAVCTANTLTIQANVAAGTINTADGSTLNYIVVEPAA